MQITKLSIANYRSFDPEGETLIFPSPHCALVGKNNSGKTNIFNAINLIFGSRNPVYAQLEEEDFFDISNPIEIEVIIEKFTGEEQKFLYALTHIFDRSENSTSKKVESTDQDALFEVKEELVKEEKKKKENTFSGKMRSALHQSIQAGNPFIKIKLTRSIETVDEENEVENEENSKNEFVNELSLELWGIETGKQKKKNEIARRRLIKSLLVPAIRDSKNVLTASKWSHFGELMKDVLESSPKYGEIRNSLSELNLKIQEVFKTEKDKLLENAKIVSYVDDLSFQLTKENHPSELLRNLEVFVQEGSKSINIDNVGTGTQSAIIIGILELALKNKTDKFKLFCIEEPEAFIHPYGVRYLGELIKNITGDSNTQVLISTHSLSLTASFLPSEIIKLNKEDGKTKITQAENFDVEHFKRFLNQDNAEMFFSERVVLVEGETEKQLLPLLSKYTKFNNSDPNGENCNFDKKNIGIINMSSGHSIRSYMKILKAFNLNFSAILDRDMLRNRSIMKGVCEEVGVSYQTQNEDQLISDLKSKEIVIITKGEIEDLFPDEDISRISGISIDDVKKHKSENPKTSDAFKKIFDTKNKTFYAIKIADHYISSQTEHPLSGLIRSIYDDQITNITF